MKNYSKTAAPAWNSARDLRIELARKITEFMGTVEDKATSISGVSLHRRVVPTLPCRTTYHPSIIVIAQGRKQVNLGRNSFPDADGNDSAAVSETAQATGRAKPDAE